MGLEKLCIELEVEEEEEVITLQLNYRLAPGN
jgi:hypothetical protein